MASVFDRLSQALPSQYQLLRLIGEGGMGLVFEGRHTRLESRVAVKVLRPELATAEMERRFLREARILSQLSHPNIVTVHDADEADGIPYYVMDFVEGQTVEERLADGPMSAEDTVRLMTDILDALDRVHRLGVVHRDIKPANIILVEGRGVLVDFGIAHVDTTTSERTRPDRAPVTPAYASPEQRTGLPVTACTDLYALGMVGYECQTGTRWNNEQDAEAGDWINVSAPLAGPLRKALERQPDKRWASAAAFREALNPARRRPVLPIMAAVVITALAVLFGGRAAGFLKDGACRMLDVMCPAPTTGVDLALEPFEVIGDTIAGSTFAGYVARRLRRVPRLETTVLSDGNTTGGRRAGGTLMRQPDGWVLEFVYTDPERGGDVSRRFVLDGDSPLPLADSAAIGIVNQYFRDFQGRIHMPTTSIEALGNWFAGEVAFQEDLWLAAENLFTAALREDPDFALAQWRIYNTRQWGRRPVNMDLAALYQQYADVDGAFSPVDRLLIRAELEPDLDRRIAIYDTTVARHPRDYYAALQRGNELFHRGPLVGYSLDESLQALEDAQDIEPHLAPSYNQTLWGAIRLGERERAGSALARRKQIPTAPSAADVDASTLFEWAYHERFNPEIGMRFRQSVMDNPSGPLAGQVAQLFRIALSLDIPRTQLALGDWMARSDDFQVGDRRNGHLGAGLALIMLGRPHEGALRLDQAASATNVTDAELVAWQVRLLLPLYGIVIDERERTQARRTLANMRDHPAYGQRATWTLALDAWHRHDLTAMEQWLTLLDDTPAANTLGPSLREVLETLRLGEQNPTEAIRLSRSLLATDSAGRGTDPFVRSLMYWHRADWLEAVGDVSEAERAWLWYENSDFGFYPTGRIQAAEIDWTLGSYARVERAEVQLQSPNRVREACGHLERVLELWDDAEESVRPWRRRAEQLTMEHCRP